MITTIQEPNFSVAWLTALEHLLACGGRDVHLTVAFDHAGAEQRDIRRLLDRFLAEQRSQRVLPVRTVANTIFPHALYRPDLGDQARSHLYRTAQLGRAVSSRHSANKRGTYFGRLMAWPGSQPPVNQLERTIERLKRQLASGGPKSSAYELSLADAGCDPAADGQEVYDSTGEMLMYLPGKDTLIMGFPCLSHISLTLVQRQLHLSATYRNQHFIRKAYGNYLGLHNLLGFIAGEAGCSPGKVICVATHADAELGSGRGFGKQALSELARECRAKVHQAQQ